MLRPIVTAAVLLCMTGAASAQTLFRYGSDSVSVSEFMTAYRKNNTSGKAGPSINEYLDLYIASRLKVKEARRLGIDTLPQMVTDLQNLRDQLAPNYLNELAGIDMLVKEAFERGKKNMRVSHIFLSARDGQADAARERAAQVLERLRKGVSFETVAREVSEDPSAKFNGGDLGWISVGTLPYQLETLAWNLPVGQVSSLERTSAGYHIFRKVAERPDPGRFRGAQILLAFPPGASESDRAILKNRADSLYRALQKGADFGKLATQFSNDVVSAASRGEMQEIRAGQYEPAFEEQLFRLPKDGALSAPFRTSYGWHVVKRLELRPYPKELGAEVLPEFKDLVSATDRMGQVRGQLAKQVRGIAGLEQLHQNQQELFAYTDSALANRGATVSSSALNASTPLFRIGNERVTLGEWIPYAQVNRERQQGGYKPWPQVWEEFVDFTAIEHYKRNLERYNPAFKAQLDEFSDGNLFFEITQREVWGPAQSDTAALEAYFSQHRDRYRWKDGADAVVFFAPDMATARSVYQLVAKKPAAWRAALEPYDDRVAADSARFELEQIPNAKKLPLKPGLLTEPQVNPNAQSVTFALVLRLRPGGTHRTFAEARGLAATDYQKAREEQWLNTLRARYPVTINQAALLELMKK